MDGDRLAAGFDHSYSLEDHNRYFTPANHFEDDVKLPAVQPGSHYYSTTFIADHAIKCLREHAAKYSGQPFFQYLAFTSPHFPLQALPEDIAIYQERYQSGWDALRAERLARMKQLGLVNCDLSKLEPEVAPRWNLTEEELRKQISTNELGHAVPWDSLTAGQKQFQAAKMAVHAAMVHRMDIEIGRVLAQLKTMDAIDNTVVFFLSDNGASPEQIIRGDGHDPAAPLGSARTFLGIGPGWSSAANTPFRLHKSWTYEGGITTPLIVHWPAGLKARNELRTTPGHLIDLVPTVLDLAGGKLPAEIAGMPVPPLPGRSLVPVFAQDGSVKRDCLWWYHDGNRAVRVGDWKLVADYQSPWELYDLRVDRCESKNLSAAYPGKVKELEQVWLKRVEELRALAAQDLPAGTNQPALDPNAKPATEKAAPTPGPAEGCTTAAFKLKLKPGMAAEYKRRHDAIWPELSQAIRSAGISDYSIFLDEETETLFAIQKLAPNNTAGEFRKSQILKKWWDYMAPLMEVNPDNSPVRVPLKEVFHQD
jgi:arylsulfatase